jgi:pyrroloquinoline quinone biosynthesis protein D
VITRESVPGLRRGVRRQFDQARNTFVLQAPERVIVLDDIAAAITELVDTKHSVAQISLILAERFAADATLVETDVTAFIQDLVDKNLAAA